MNQIDLWDVVQDHHTYMVEFLEWLGEHEAIQLGPQSENCPFKLLDDFKPSNLADKFLGVDRKALDAERRQLLEIADGLSFEHLQVLIEVDAGEFYANQSNRFTQLPAKHSTMEVALADLVARGCIVVVGDEHRLTESGNEVLNRASELQREVARSG